MVIFESNEMPMRYSSQNRLFVAVSKAPNRVTSVQECDATMLKTAQMFEIKNL
jgi:hypothetical protein